MLALLRIVAMSIILFNANVVRANDDITTHIQYKIVNDFIESVGKHEYIKTIVEMDNKRLTESGKFLDPYTKVKEISASEKGMTMSFEFNVVEALRVINNQRLKAGDDALNAVTLKEIFVDKGEYYVTQLIKLCSEPATRAALDNDIIYFYKVYDENNNSINNFEFKKSLCVINKL